MKTPNATATPRTEGIMRLFEVAARTLNSDDYFAAKEAIENGIANLERELSVLRQQLAAEKYLRESAQQRALKAEDAAGTAMRQLAASEAARAELIKLTNKVINPDDNIFYRPDAIEALRTYLEKHKP